MIYYLNRTHLADYADEMVLIGKEMDDHGAVRTSFKEHSACVGMEKEGLDETRIFICRLDSGHNELAILSTSILLRS